MSSMFKSPKVAAPTVTATPTITDTTRQSQDAIDELLRRRGRLSTMKTGASGAPLQSQTAASTLLGA